MPEPVCPGAAHCMRRRLLFTAWCEHQAVLPHVRTCLHLAQEAENAEAYRQTLALRERLLEERDDLERRLWQLDAEWSLAVLGHRSHLPWEERQRLLAAQGIALINEGGREDAAEWES
jgi:hypothetical protein